MASFSRKLKPGIKSRWRSSWVAMRNSLLAIGPKLSSSMLFWGKRKPGTERKSKNSQLIWPEQKNITKNRSKNSPPGIPAKSSTCRIACCRLMNFSAPGASTLLRVKPAHMSYKTVFEDSYRRRSGLAAYWTTPATQQSGFALRFAGKLQIRLLP